MRGFRGSTETDPDGGHEEFGVRDVRASHMGDAVSRASVSPAAAQLSKRRRLASDTATEAPPALHVTSSDASTAVLEERLLDLKKLEVKKQYVKT